MWYDSRIIQISPDKHVLQSQSCLTYLTGEHFLDLAGRMSYTI